MSPKHNRYKSLNVHTVRNRNNNRTDIKEMESNQSGAINILNLNKESTVAFLPGGSNFNVSTSELGQQAQLPKNPA